MKRFFWRLPNLCRAMVLAFFAAMLFNAAEAADLDSDFLVFVSGRASNEIVAIDTRTDEVSVRYSAPGVVTQSLIAGDLGRLVAISVAPRKIHLFDIATGRLERSVDPGFAATEMRLSADGNTLAVAGLHDLAFLDLASAEIRQTVSIAGTPGAMIFDRSGDLLLLADARHDRIHLVHRGPSAGIETLYLAGGSAGKSGVVHLARTPGGGTAMAVLASGEAAIIDLKTRTVAKRLSLPGRHARIFPTVNSQYFLVPNLSDRTVSIISTWTHAESERLEMKGDISALNTVLADTVLYAFDRRSAVAEVFDLDRRRRYKNIALPGKPEATAIGAGGLKIYVAFNDIDAIAVLDVRTVKIAKIIPDIGLSPSAIFDGGNLSYCH